MAGEHRIRPALPRRDHVEVLPRTGGEQQVARPLARGVDKGRETPGRQRPDRQGVLLMTRHENVGPTTLTDEKPGHPGDLVWQVSGAQPQTPRGRPEPGLLQCQPEG